ncbi:hypothetical protein TIFTF001_045564 [Ficus carica]|uniref:Uncharacterized protein n=1 Tax=Ficus carica TaxID=3494 RepID=A0AA88CID7_FICCA|nr:hypothetical protein TIFTF001_045564 [Ficus carica]
MRLQWPRFSLKPDPDRAQDPCTARIDSTGDLNVLKTKLEYSTQQCPGELKLDSGHSERKQGKYNSAYSIGFVVYTCLRNVTKNAMIVSSLPVTVDARWRGVAWQTVKCGKISHYAF